MDQSKEETGNERKLIRETGFQQWIEKKYRSRFRGRSNGKIKERIK